MSDSFGVAARRTYKIKIEIQADDWKKNSSVSLWSGGRVCAK